MPDAPEISDLPLPTGSTRATSERRGSYMVQLDCRVGHYAGVPVLLAILALSLAGRINFATSVACVGAISAGVYVWHDLFHWYFMPLGMGAVGLPPQRFSARFAIYVVGSLLIATTSGFVMERPINALKRFYPYRDPPMPKPLDIPPAWSGMLHAGILPHPIAHAPSQSLGRKAPRLA